MWQHNRPRPQPHPLQLSHLRADFDQEKGAMEETVRGLTREVWLHQLVIDSYIPDQYQQLIHSHSTWNEDTGEWHLVSNNTQSSDNLSLSLSLSLSQRGLAYAGNNVRRPPTPTEEQVSSDSVVSRFTGHIPYHRNRNGTPEWPISPTTSQGPKFTLCRKRSEVNLVNQLFIRRHGHTKNTFLSKQLMSCDSIENVC